MPPPGAKAASYCFWAMDYRFADRVLDTDTVELRDSAGVVEIEPQVFEVLRYLLEHRERVVSKEELLDRVWGDRFVSESALTTRIKQVRQAVGDDGRAQGVIKTVHGRGYRFVAPVVEGGAPEQPPITEMPRTQYAEADGAHIAYQTFGEGPDLVLIAGFATNVEVQWEHPAIAELLRALGSICRVTVLDKRGVGLSDRLSIEDPPPVEVRAADLGAVMDAAGVARATVLGSSEAGSLAIIFAATHPERVERLVLYGSWAKPYVGRVESDLEGVARYWGTGGVYAAIAPRLAADKAGRRFLARFERQSATPRTAVALREEMARTDVSGVLGSISVPTLVLHRRHDDWVPYEYAEALASGIPGARLQLLEGRDRHLFAAEPGPMRDAIEEFMKGSPPSPAPSARVLATVLVVDLVDATPASLRSLHESARPVLAEHRGDVVVTTGDGVVATFDGPGRAVHAACALCDAATSLDLRVRAGLHTAEIERRGDDIAGLGVDIASRVAEAAGPGEIWVSRTVTDLVAGAGIEFEDGGLHSLRGLDQPWTLCTVRR
jgi:DNA-binding winged helix-turn-helix (wHTH) protein/class 3 adenylate cyclase